MGFTRFSSSVLFSFILSFAAVCTGLLQPVQAQDDSNLFLDALPSDTFLYIEMNNIQDHVSRTRDQIYGQMSDEQKKTFDRRKDQLIDTLTDRVEKEAGVNPMKILPHITRVQVAVPSSEFDFGSGMGGDVPVKDASVLVSVQVDRPDVFSQLLSGKLAKKLSPEQSVNGYTVYRIKVPDQVQGQDVPAPFLLQKGNQMYFSEDANRLAGIAEGKGSSKLPSDSLAQKDGFLPSRSEATAEDLMRAHMNVDSFWNQLRASLNEKQKAIYQKIADNLGFEEMQSVSMNLRSGKGVSALSVGVNLSGKDFPLYDLLFQVDPGKSTLLDTIPGDAFSGSVIRLPDYAERLPAIKQKAIQMMTAFGQKKEKAEEQWKMVMMMARKQMNVGVEELLGQIGNEMVIYFTSPEKTSDKKSTSKQYMKNFVMRVAADDGEAFQSMFEDQIRSSDGYKQMKEMESTGSYQGTTFYSYKTPESIQPTLFFKEDQLVIAGSKEAARSAFEGPSGPSITEKEWFRSLRGELPESTSSLGFLEYVEYTRYMLALQEEAGGNQWTGGLPFGQEMIEKLYNAAGGELGAVSSISLHKDRISGGVTAEIDFSVVDPDSVNKMLKKMNKDLEKSD